MKYRHVPSSAGAFVVLAIAVAFVGVTGCGKKDSAAAGADDVVATVNGQAISKSDYYDYLIRKSNVLVSTQQGTQAAETFYPVGVQALRDMIDRTLILQLAKEQGVMPTDADVQKEIDFRNASRPGYTDEMVQKGGISMDELKKEVQFDLARDHILTKGVTVPMTEVDQYIKENPKQFTVPAQVSLLMIALKSPANKAKVDAALAAGKSFKSVAAQYSEDPNAKTTGGAVPPMAIDQLPPTFKAVLDKTAPLHATDWIQQSTLSLKLYVLSKTPAKPVEMTAVKKQELQRSMMLERGRLTNDMNSKLLTKLRSASVDVDLASLKRPWDELFTEIKKAPLPSASGGPAPGGPATGGPGPGGPAPTGSAGAPPPAKAPSATAGSSPHF